MHGRAKPQKHPKKREPNASSASSSSSSTSKLGSVDSLSAAISAADSGGPPTSRRSSRRKATAEDDSPDDDNASTASTSSSSDAANGADSPELHNSNKLHEAIEGLGEKRSSSRVAALTSLVALLTSAHVPQLLQPQQETLSDLLVASLKKGDSSEAALTCHALSLLAVSLPEENDTVWRAAGGALTEAMRNKSKSAAVRAAATRALTFLRFLLTEHDDELVDTMSELLALLPPSPLPAAAGQDEFEVAVLDGWGLLACAVSGHMLPSFMVRVMPQFTAYLHSESVEVRMAVGENIATLFAAYHEHNPQAEDEDEADGADEPHDDAITASAQSFNPLSPVDHHHRRTQPEPPRTTAAERLSILQSTLRHDLIPLLSTLSTDASRHRARKERREQRASFRDILASVETGEQPSMQVTIRKQRVDLDGWRAVRVWEAVREVLGGGVGVHLSENELVAGLIGWQGEEDGVEGEDMDDRTKRLEARQASKGRAKEAYQLHNKQRSKKSQHLDASLY